MKSRSNPKAALVEMLAAAVVLVLATSAAHAQISARDAQALANSKLIYIATVRKGGTQSKPAPVWFTISADNKEVLIQTGPKTWKAKRIRRGSPAIVWIGSATGPAFIGKAEITGDGAVQKKILDDFHEKYWENRVMGVGPSRARFDSGEKVAIKITPVRDLPEGFASAPGTSAPPLEERASTPGTGS